MRSSGLQFDDDAPPVCVSRRLLPIRDPSVGWVVNGKLSGSVPYSSIPASSVPSLSHPCVPNKKSVLRSGCG